MKEFIQIMVNHGISEVLANKILNNAIHTASKYFDVVKVIDSLNISFREYEICDTIVSQEVVVSFKADNNTVYYRYPTISRSYKLVVE